MYSSYNSKNDKSNLSIFNMYEINLFDQILIRYDMSIES